ncbi:MAG TPA: glutaredoxin family protein [Actinomycetota bacterium]|nr:glutaredoxin family protein [Actinomycetota bacterium]
MSDVVLYSKPGCCLCDDAKAALEIAGTAFREVDISRDPGLMNEFGVSIPVVEVGGHAVFEAGMNPADLPELVKQAIGGR